MAYGKVHEKFWDDPRIRALSERGRMFMLYLMTCRHKNRLGCYVLDPHYAAADLQWSAADVTTALDELQAAGRIEYDGEHRVVFVTRFLKHNVLENSNVAKGAVGELDSLPDTPLLPKLLAAVEKWKRPHYEDIATALRNRLPNGSGNHSATNRYTRSLAVAKPCLNQAVAKPSGAHTPEAALSEGPAAPTAGTSTTADVDSHDRDPPAAPTADREDVVSEIIRAANHGMIQNDAIGTSFNPIPAGHGSRQFVTDWLDAGIPAQLILGVVVERARAYQPSGRHRQISTMKYFDSAVRDEHDRALAASRPPVNENPGSERRAIRAGFVSTGGRDLEREKEQEAEREATELAQWTRENPDEAAAIRAEVEGEMRSDPQWKDALPAAIRVVATAKYRAKARERMHANAGANGP